MTERSNQTFAGTCRTKPDPDRIRKGIVRAGGGRARGVSGGMASVFADAHSTTGWKRPTSPTGTFHGADWGHVKWATIRD